MLRRERSEEAGEHGYTPAEYREVVRRAQQLRAEREGRISRELLEASAAEVGITEDELREAERLLGEEQRARAAAGAEQRKRRATFRLVAVAAAVLLCFWLGLSYNGLSARSQAAGAARANLQATLQRRADLLPNLARLAREGAAAERALLDRIAVARERLQSGDPARQLEGSAEVGRIAGEAGPQLRSSTAYRDLLAQVEGSENRINVARQRYNRAAEAYNRAAQSFPNNLARPLFGLPGQLSYYEPPGNVESAPAL